MQNKNKISLIGFVVWIVCDLFFMYEFLLRIVVGTFQTSIIQDLHLTTITFAIISSAAYQIAYGAMQIPVGFLTDRFGLKKSLFVAAVFCAVSTLVFSFAQNFHMAVILRILMGLGSSFGFICILIAVYDWMPQKNRALFIGLSAFISTVGPMFAGGPLQSIAQHGAISWRTVFFILGICGLIISLLVIIFVHNNKEQAQVGGFTVLSKTESIKTSFFKLFKRKEPIFIGIISACIYFSIEYFSENQTPQYLGLYGYSASFASYMVTLAWLGYAIGCIGFGSLSDYFSRRKTPLVVALIICLAALSIVIYYPINKILLTAAFFMLGLGASGNGIGFVMIAEYCESNYLALALGLNNGTLMLVTAITAPIVGKILTMLAGSNATHFTISQYHTAFTLIMAVVGVGLCIAVFGIKETFAKSQREFVILSRS